MKFELDLSRVKDADIDWGHVGSNGDNRALDSRNYDRVSRREYFKDYDDNGKMLFAPINHIGVATKDGVIPPDAITRVDMSLSENARPVGPLYHGSPLNLGTLVPKDSGVMGKHLFAVDDIRFALAYIGPWDDLVINQTVHDGVYYLTEIKKDAFATAYGKRGYLYVVDPKGFRPNVRHSIYTEYVSDRDTVPRLKIPIDDPLDRMEREGVIIVRWPNLPPFIEDRHDYVIKKCRQFKIKDPESYWRNNYADDER